MHLFDRKFLTHFDFIQIFPIIFLAIVSNYLILEANATLALKQYIYFILSFIIFMVLLVFPIRKFYWLIPTIYSFNIFLMICVHLFGVKKLGAQRWIEIPFTHFTIQPSEFAKISLLLMLGYAIKTNPPPNEGYGLKKFGILNLYILIPVGLTLKEPDLGSALVMLSMGYIILFVIGINKKIWIWLLIIMSLLGGFGGKIIYNKLHDYQKKRITEFINEPSYHVKQSIIAIGSGGWKGNIKEDTTQTHNKFLPISTSDFIFPYGVERFGYFFALSLFGAYGFLIYHLLALNNKLEDDYMARVFATGISALIFVYTTINVSMTIGFAPVTGIPLPMFSYGGSSFITFIMLFGILQHLITFKFKT